MVKIAHASIDERGKVAGGRAGDQTKKEVCIRTWYKKSWNVVIRPKSKEVANRIVKEAKAGANNNKIGYDQNQRNTLLAQAKKVNFDLSKIATACECDCSSLVSVLMIAAGAKESDIVKGGNCATTSTLRSRAKETGLFDILTDKKYLDSDEYIKAGDIIVKEGSHVVIALENGKNTTTGGKVKVELTVLKKGSKGKQVGALQSLLKGYGYSIGKSGVDKSFGSDTEKAVKAFQKVRKLKQDGIVGKDTWSELLGLN